MRNQAGGRLDTFSVTSVSNLYKPNLQPGVKHLPAAQLGTDKLARVGRTVLGGIEVWMSRIVGIQELVLLSLAESVSSIELLRCWAPSSGGVGEQLLSPCGTLRASGVLRGRFLLQARRCLAPRGLNIVL